MPITKPDWIIPKNISEIVADDEMWEDERWSPLLLSVIGGVSYKGREIPLFWQIEFEPFDEVFDAANQRLEALGVEPDGYAWADLVASAVAKNHPELIDELQFGDTEMAACVVWVESEDSCKTLMNVIWSLVHDN